MKIEDLKLNSVIDNQHLCEIFKCAPQGGMRRSHTTNTLVLISDRTNIYQDKQTNGIYHYTGMGQVGDQELTSQNKTLAESKTNGVAVHFFEVLKKRQYTYRGEVELAGEPYIDRQTDIKGNMRNVWVFPLTKIADNGWINEIDHLENELGQQNSISNTEKEQVIKSRIGQSTFKEKLLKRECKCAICGVADRNFLIGSHIKPWSKSNNAERLDVNNGLLLCPNHDALFDKGYISFDEDGQLVLSSQLDDTTKIFMNIQRPFRIEMTVEMKKYIKYHYDHIRVK
ncbi:HNH endonuclease [Bacillus sp. FJAT-29814]|uniref:HNH endonuclease n=1 Tax=Bacillus sp. FJAT-29814 TaxID=1729688 RepID=UPI000ACA311D|nr:HNH endonuclease signature motif containing protein [Bacillus sp. FJAT-29814]